jgi:hypothetical protein
LKIAAYIGGLLGLAVLITLVLRADAAAMLVTLGMAGSSLLWLVPYRALYFLLYALGWQLLLRPYDRPRRAGICYLWWATTVREGIDRLLPVASVGGSVAGIRLLRWRGIAAAPAGASVIVEIVLTLSAAYLFTALGLFLLIRHSGGVHEYRRVLLALALCLPMPTVTALLLRYGSVFARLERLLGPLIGVSALSDGAAALDQELRACLRRGRLRDLVHVAPVRAPHRLEQRDRAREHDAGAAPSRLRGTGGPRRPGSEPDDLRARARHQRRTRAERIDGQADTRSAVRPAGAAVLALDGSPSAARAGARPGLNPAAAQGPAGRSGPDDCRRWARISGVL